VVTRAAPPKAGDGMEKGPIAPICGFYSKLRGQAGKRSNVSNEESAMEKRADILIIEDDRDIVSSMRIILESRHYRVREAYDGKQGYAKIEEKMPDLIILDVMMSTETDGFELAYKLQNTTPYKKIPILMLSSFPKKMVEEGSEKFQHLLGDYWPVAHFLEKPVEPEELLSAVENLIAQPKQP
jgi:CheY-like chemotaxis protein